MLRMALYPLCPAATKEGRSGLAGCGPVPGEPPAGIFRRDRWLRSS